MATFLVISTADDGAGSLRQALADAEENEGADTITFAPWLSGQTIRLSSTLEIQSGEVSIEGDLDGDGAADVDISGDDGDASWPNSGDIGLLIAVGAGANVTLDSMRFSGGANYNPSTGENVVSGIFNAGTLTMIDSVVEQLGAYGGTGADTSTFAGTAGAGGLAVSGIFNTGTLTISDTVFDELHAQGGVGGAAEFGYGGRGGLAVGGIFNDVGGTVTLTNFLVGRGDGFGGAGGYGYFDGGNGGHGIRVFYNADGPEALSGNMAGAGYGSGGAG